MTQMGNTKSDVFPADFCWNVRSVHSYPKPVGRVSRSTRSMAAEAYPEEMPGGPCPLISGARYTLKCDTRSRLASKGTSAAAAIGRTRRRRLGLFNFVTT